MPSRLGVTLAIVAGMTPAELKSRTRTFAVEVIKFASRLPTNPAATVIMKQLVKSGTSVGANYRSSCRAKSRADFISKMAIAEEEVDETQYWLELLVESAIVSEAAAARLMEEAEQLVRIFVASINTARRGPR